MNTCCKSKKEWIYLVWKFSVNQNFLVITFRSITLIWDDAQVSGHWAIEKTERGGGITPCLQLHYLKLFIPSLTRKLHFYTQYSLHSLSNEMDDEYIEKNCRYNVITVYSRYYSDRLLRYIGYNVWNSKHKRGSWATSLTWENSSYKHESRSICFCYFIII